MTAIRVPLTCFEDYLDEDQAALYLESGSGNIPGVNEVHLTFFDPTGLDAGDEEPITEITLGWVAVDRLRDALNALDIPRTVRISA